MNEQTDTGKPAKPTEKSNVKRSSTGGIKEPLKLAKNEVVIPNLLRNDFGIIDAQSGKTRTVPFHDVLGFPFNKDIGSKDIPHFSLPLAIGNSSHIELPLGLTVISGPTAGGKSTFLRRLGIPRAIANEPHDTADDLTSLSFHRDPDSALLEIIMRSLRSDELHGLDSFRGGIFNMQGPAGSKGVIMPFFSRITDISNALALQGLTVIATVNPMNSDPEYVTEFLSKLSSAVPCFISLNTSLEEMRADLFKGSIYTRTIRQGAGFTMIGSPGVPDPEYRPLASPATQVDSDENNTIDTREDSFSVDGQAPNGYTPVSAIEISQINGESL